MAGLPVHDGLLQVFDVEHGACALLTVPAPGDECRRMLIDCGHNSTTGWNVGSHLRNLGVSYLEQFVITNYDEDHASGHPYLAQNSVNVAWMLRNPTVSAQVVKTLKTDDGMGKGIDSLVSALGHFTLTPSQVVPPEFPNVFIEWFWNPYPYFTDENNLSLVLHLKIHGFSFLFPGDLECAGFRHMLKTNQRFREVVCGIHILVASHHGRENGICPEMFDVWGCRPRLVVISDDYKQYDTQETVQYYASKCSGISDFRRPGNVRRVLTTRYDGELIFTFASGNCYVS
ncbi:ComEC/Rec2 family competence protein [Paraburkholderia monticola]|nr:hypothetical protein [Paraburkholderia monticola]